MLALTKDDLSGINEGKIVDQIRALGIDMIHEAKSGHPGIVLGAAPIIYTLYAHHLRFDTKELSYYNRDRFVMSAGHGSALLYATLSLAGFPIEIEDLKKFRQIDSIVPGHPEYGLTPGVEMTTGPLGQGFASAVGMAIAKKHTKALLSCKSDGILDYRIYCLCGDGDLMEGVSYEAASLAGTLALNDLIVLYDSNQVCLDGRTDETFTENMEERFRAMGWEVITTTDEISAINKAIEKAKSSNKPSLIQVKTIIGKYSCNAGKNIVHGKPLDDSDITSIKNQMNIRDIPFSVSNEVVVDFQSIIAKRNKNAFGLWKQRVDQLGDDDKNLLRALTNSDKSIDITMMNYEQPADHQESLREASSKILNSLSSPLIIGGAADLSSSTLTYLNDGGNFSSTNYQGKNLMFGVREFAMACIANGLALSGYRPFVSTYLSFSDYLRPALRLSCLMELPVTYIFTHDSITVAEDGPTHQPVEQLVSLRAMPNLEVFRPADSNEVIGVYKTIYQQNQPAAIILGRNKTKILDTTSVPLVADGAYIVKNEERKLDGIIVATGEEVALAMDVSSILFEKGYDLRVVSMPSIERYMLLDKQQKEELLPIIAKKFVIEFSSSYSWHFLVSNPRYLFTVDSFGMSGKKDDILENFSFTKDMIANKIEELLK